jgi:uncharacterized membrane-anchored protein
MKKHKRKEFTFPALLSMGVGFALASLLAVAMLLAVISYFTADPTAYTGAFSLLSLVAAGAVSGFVTSRVNGEGGVSVATLSALITAALIAVVGLIWKGGLLPLGALLNLAAFSVTSVAAAALGKPRKSKHRRKY